MEEGEEEEDEKAEEEGGSEGRDVEMREMGER